MRQFLGDGVGAEEPRSGDAEPSHRERIGEQLLVVDCTFSQDILFATLRSNFASLCRACLWREPSGQMCPVLASTGGEGQRLQGYAFQAHFRLGRRQILLHSPSAGAGKPGRECLNAAACVMLRMNILSYVVTSFCID